MRTALAIAAHPDDETIGVGGTLAKLALGGWTVHSVFLPATAPTSST